MEDRITPGWYRSAQPWARNAIRVHLVNNGKVYFTRRGIPNMSCSPIASFIGLIILDETD